MSALNDSVGLLPDPVGMIEMATPRIAVLGIVYGLGIWQLRRVEAPRIGRAFAVAFPGTALVTVGSYTHAIDVALFVLQHRLGFSMHIGTVTWVSLLWYFAGTVSLIVLLSLLFYASARSRRSDVRERQGPDGEHDEWQILLWWSVTVPLALVVASWLLRPVPTVP